ncbi:hypothetical protein [Frigoriflavimonas asaccharolytica]|uniref:Uncharacterized protein n=1 Tax=Frigoriflavimonas asaccharolytica TaxID=2735899 RepID=A0A8J8GAZ4_9FLAO|nr:hypothetical protein [Frigoriflavimonas asaccharolytica]NRS94191.1 hypothetical protein [Frigoriflavimonas asaccharolytica]
MNKNLKFLIIIFILISFQSFSQTRKKKDCFTLNPIINTFINNLINKDVSINDNYLTLISLKDNEGNYNIDLQLTSGNLETFKIVSPNEVKIKYGNIKILLIGKTAEDLKFLKKAISKANRIFLNGDGSLNNKSFFDEVYVWSLFFNSRKELINIYLPEERQSAYKIFNEMKDKINISSNFKSLDCNCF